MKDKKQQINVPCCPEFVSGGPEFVSGFPVAYGRKGRLLLTLLLRALDLAFVVLVILSWDSKNRAVQLVQVAPSAVTAKRAMCWGTPNKRSALGLCTWHRDS